jgi:stage IV sporulation protein B
MAGIGTMTYYDPQTGEFGALGHGITDVDTNQLMPFMRGTILPSTVKAVKKGTVGSAGELRGDFDLSSELGGLTANTAAGVFGVLEDGDYAAGKAVPVGTAVPGKAVIRSNVEGDTTQEYAIEILKVCKNAADGRDLVISVKDRELLDTTGGIVQGMSGSPIIQDGKLVGAVTHVLVNDPTRGYGIFIENMLDAAS